MTEASLVEQQVGLLLAVLPRLQPAGPGPWAVECTTAHPKYLVTVHEADPSAVELEDRDALALAAAPPGTALLAHLIELADSLADSVDGVEPVEVSDAVLVEGMAAAGRQEAQAAALRLRFTAELEHRRHAEAEAAVARAPGSWPWGWRAA